MLTKLFLTVLLVAFGLVSVEIASHTQFVWQGCISAACGFATCGLIWWREL